MKGFTTAEIAEKVAGTVDGDTTLRLTGFAGANAAKVGDLTFAENDTYLAQAEKSDASAILVSHTARASSKTLIRVAKARIAFARVLPFFFPEREFAAGVHPTAVVAPSARVSPDAHIGPYCVIEADCVIEAKVVLRGHVHIDFQCHIGAGSHLFPNVTVYAGTRIGCRTRIHSGTVIGSDGFGYVLDEGFQRKVPQIGNVIIGDDVEIGANVTIDRGALGSTVIGSGTKIDNLVQIGHNVVMGEHCLLISQVGIAGSTKMGNLVTIGGQAGVSGHIKIGNGATVAGQSGVMHDVPDGEKWWGMPAVPDRKFKRQLLAQQRLPDLLRRVEELETLLRERTPEAS